MRYLIKFSKGEKIKFISHLDLMRTMEKIIRRSELPIKYSNGFNPHMAISFAQPLSVGVYSDGEYMDVVFEEELDENHIKDTLNANSSLSIKIEDVIKVRESTGGKKIKQTMALIDAASYVLKIKYENTDFLEEDMKNLMKKPQWNCIKKSKKGKKEVDIKPMVKSFDYSIYENMLEVNTLISCGSRENLSAQLLAEYIQNNTRSAIKEAFVEIKRNNMYILNNNKLMRLDKYFKNFK